MRVGAVVGLPIEAAVLRFRARQAFGGPSNHWIKVAHADTVRAEAFAETLISQGAEGLVSFGIAGGLDPSLHAGTLILATEIVLPGGQRLATDNLWRQRMADALRGLGIHQAPIAGTDRMLASVAAKAELATRTGAIAVDMESHGVARVAARNSVPVLALRAIADSATRALPGAVTDAVGQDGRIRASAVAAALLASPGQIPAMANIVVDTSLALATLWRAAGRIGLAL
jgi:adenosylhomocysteine nucleosidase